MKKVILAFSFAVVASVSGIAQGVDDYKKARCSSGIRTARLTPAQIQAIRQWISFVRGRTSTGSTFRVFTI